MNPKMPNAATAPMSVRLHIERLVLDGVPGDARHLGRLRAALEVELGRLLSAHAAGGLSSGTLHLASVDAPEVRWSANADPTDSGRQLAQAIFAGVSSTLRPVEDRRTLGTTAPVPSGGSSMPRTQS
ncbi:MAG: hypothetical protein JNK85_06425 [Verrucomicrobiales bacterium]|nr:hypothetical protein [Verrucomicrobiales bacterium]